MGTFFPTEYVSSYATTVMLTDMEKVIRVGMFHDPPFSFGLQEQSSHPAGIADKIVNLFCQTQNVTCQFFYEQESCYGVKVNGTWTGMIKHLIDGLYDLGSPYFTPDKERLQVVDFSPPVAYAPLILVTRRSMTVTGHIDLLSSFVYHWSSWLLLLFFSLSVGLLIALAQISKGDGNSSYKFIAKNVFAFVTNQTNDITFTRLSIRIVFGCWSLAIVVFVGVYSGKLSSTLVSNSNTKLPFNNFETFVQCIETKHCRFLIPTTYINSLFRFNRSESEIDRRLMKALRQNPVISGFTVPASFSEIVKETQYYTVALMGVADFAYNVHSNETCMYTMRRITNNDTYIAFPLRKNSTFKRQLNSFVNHGVQTGLFQHLFMADFGAHCELPNSYNKEFVKINVFEFVSCIFIFLVGITTSSVAFLIEIIKMRIQKYFGI